MNDQADRVRRHTAAEVLRRIDDLTVTSLSRCASSPGETDRRLKALDAEWDTDRALEIESATMGLVGLTLGALLHKRLLALPAIVARCGPAAGHHGALPPHAAVPAPRIAHRQGDCPRALRPESAAR